jgi:hypothetical protein
MRALAAVGTSALVLAVGGAAASPADWWIVFAGFDRFAYQRERFKVRPDGSRLVRLTRTGMKTLRRSGCRTVAAFSHSPTCES